MRKRKGDSYLGGHTLLGPRSDWWSSKSPKQLKGIADSKTPATTQVWIGRIKARKIVDVALRAWARRHSIVRGVFVSDAPPKGTTPPGETLIYLVVNCSGAGDLRSAAAREDVRSILSNVSVSEDPRRDILAATRGARHVFSREP